MGYSRSLSLPPSFLLDILTLKDGQYLRNSQIRTHSTEYQILQLAGTKRFLFNKQKSGRRRRRRRQLRRRSLFRQYYIIIILLLLLSDYNNDMRLPIGLNVPTERQQPWLGLLKGQISTDQVLPSYSTKYCCISPRISSNYSSVLVVEKISPQKKKRRRKVEERVPNRRDRLYRKVLSRLNNDKYSEGELPLVRLID